MQQVLSLRFLATLMALAALLGGLILTWGRPGLGAETATTRPLMREVHLLEVVESARADGFALTSGGRSRGVLEIGLRDDRTMRIVEGTFGENGCGIRLQPGACAVAAQVIGDAVVWFALLPIGSGDVVELPAIDTLQGGRAQLVNGWRLPYARVLERRCPVEFASYREFRAVLGDRFDAIYSLEFERIVAVVCHAE